MNGILAKAKKSAKLKNTVHKSSIFAKSTLVNIVIAVIVIGISYVILSPIIGIVSDAFMDLRDLYNPLVYLIPRVGSLSNFEMALKYTSFAKAFPETLMFTLGLTAIQVFITSLVGYGFARFRFPGREIWFALVIVTIVIPPQTLMVSMYTQFRYFDLFGLFSLFGKEPVSLINTYIPSVMMATLGMGLKSGLYIFIFRQFFRGLPKEIEEAAFIDGAGTAYTYFKVMLPNAVPSIVTVVLFSFVWQYNDTFFSSMLMNQKDLIANKLASVGSTFATKESIMDPNHRLLVTNAAIVLGISPIIAIYVMLQRYFMEGVERSGIVG